MHFQKGWRPAGGELVGDRTRDPRIKSALLYQLSYELPKAFQYQGSTAELPPVPGGLQPYPFVPYIAKGTTLAISCTAARMLLYSLKNLVFCLPVGIRGSGNKKVVRRGNRQGVIVWLIGSPQNVFKGLFCKLCHFSRRISAGAILKCFRPRFL